MRVRRLLTEGLEGSLCGLLNSTIQRKLLAEANLDFSQTCEIVQTMDMADWKTLQLKPESVSDIAESSATVHKISQPQGQFTSGLRDTKQGDMNMMKQVSKPCFHCSEYHLRENCRFRDCVCFKCGRKGPISKTCRIKPGGQSSQSAGYRKGAAQKGAVRYMVGEDEEDLAEDREESEDFGIYSLYAPEESTPKPGTQTRVDPRS